MNDVKIVYFDNEEDVSGQYDAYFFVKALPSLRKIKTLDRAKLFFVPIDYFSYAYKVELEAIKLQYFHGILCHSLLLANRLNASAPIYYIDHYAKFPFKHTHSSGDKRVVAWVGVHKYIASTLDYLERNNLLEKFTDYAFLTDVDALKPRRIERLKRALQKCGLQANIDKSETTLNINGIIFKQWSEAAQAQIMSECDVVIDIKQKIFREQVKPPTKCQLYAHSGIPVYVNDSHPAIEQLSSDGITLRTITQLIENEKEDTLAYGKILGEQAKDQYSLSNVAKQYCNVFEQCLSSDYKPRKFSYLSYWEYLKAKIYGVFVKY